MAKEKYYPKGIAFLQKRFEKIITFENLLLASKKAIRGKKDKKAVATFYFNLENELISLQSELTNESYRPQDYTLFEVREPKVRKICSSDFRDRVVHHAICNVIEPIFERRAIYDSYACRRGRGSHLAVARCQEYARKDKYYLKCDIKKFFDSVNHEILKKILRKIFKDPKLISLLDIIIDHEVPGNPLGKGIPIGNLTSQHFANLYLSELDHFVKEGRQIKGYVRYMDDFISFANSKEELHQLLFEIDHFVKTILKMELKQKVTKIAPVSEGVPFLGFRIYPNLIRIKRENLVRMRQKIRRKERLFRSGRIGDKELFQSVNSIVAHVSHVNSLAERRKLFTKSLNLA